MNFTSSTYTFFYDIKKKNPGLTAITPRDLQSAVIPLKKDDSDIESPKLALDCTEFVRSNSMVFNQSSKRRMSFCFDTKNQIK